MTDEASGSTLPATVAVVGLGLIGGSVARDLVARGVRVLGFDRETETLRAAEAAGMMPFDTLDSALLAQAEVVVLGLPVTDAVELLPRLTPALSASCFVTDVGSTKRSISLAAEAAGIGARFVGAHPLAGDHRSGWAAARQGLFEGAQVFLCGTASTSEQAMARIEGLWRALGSRIERLDPAAHDLRLAWTSHLPQVTASALAAALDAAGWNPGQMGPGGRDSTRLAGSSPDVWTAIARDNAESIRPAVEALVAELQDFLEALRGGRPDEVRDFFTAGRRWSQEGPTPK